MKIKTWQKASIIGTLLLIGTVAGLLIASQHVPFNGTINAVNVAIYDVEGGSIVTNLDGLNVSPGSFTEIPLYIANIGNVPITLDLYVTFDSSADAYLSMAWDYTNGTQVAVSSGANVILTLSATPGASELSVFSGNLTVTGTEVILP